MGDALDPVKRAQVIEDVVGFSIDVDLQSFRHGAVLRAAIYPRLPEELWAYVPIDVLVEVVDPLTEETTEDFQTVPANGLTIEEHGDGALPNLLAVDLPTIPSADLARFAGYCLQFYEYLSALAQKYSEVISTMNQQHKELLARLPVDAVDRDASFAAAKRAAKADSFVLELERSIVSDKQIHATLDRRMRALKERIAQCSREQTRRADAGRLYTNTGGRAGTPPTPDPQPRPQRKPFPRHRR